MTKFQIPEASFKGYLLSRSEDDLTNPDFAERERAIFATSRVRLILYMSLLFAPLVKYSSSIASTLADT